MPTSVYTCISNVYMICKHVLWITFLNEPEPFCTQLNGFKYFYITVTMEDQSFVCTQFVLFDPCIGPYQAMKGYSKFPKSPGPEPPNQVVYCHNQNTLCGGGCLTPPQRCSWCFLQPHLTRFKSKQESFFYDRIHNLP